MSKVLTANQSAAAAETGHSQARIIEIQWESGTVYYTERGTSEINPDPAKTFLSIIASFPLTARNVNMGIVDEGPRQSAQFQIWIDPEDAGNIEVVVASESPSGTTVKTYIVLQPVSGVLEEADWIALGRYVIDSWRVEYRTDGNRISFMLSDFAQHKGETEIGRLITDELYPGARDDAFGQMIPQIFGHVEKSPGFLTSAGKRTSIASSIDEVTGVIFVADAPLDEGFLASGTIVVGNEKISYTAVDNTGPPFSFGTSGTPATRGVGGTVASSHIFGAAVVGEVDKYRFLMADRASVSTAKTITGATNATPIVITSTSHGYSNNDHVFVVGVLGNLVANGLWKISNKTDNTFALVDSVGTDAYASGGEAFLSHISAITAPKINEVALASTDYEVIVFNDGVEQVAAVEVSNLPTATEDLSFTSLTRLRDLDPPVEWDVSASSAGTEASRAVDTGDDAHVTRALIAEGEQITLSQNNDLSIDKTGIVVGAKLFVEYQGLRETASAYPIVPFPQIEMKHAGVLAFDVKLAEPPDSKGFTDLFPEGLSGKTSTFLFEGGPVGQFIQVGQFTSRYQSGYDPVNQFFVWWPNHFGLSVDSNPIITNADGQNITKSLVEVAALIGEFSTGPLIVKPQGATPGTVAKLEATIVIYSTSGVSGKIELRLKVGGHFRKETFTKGGTSNKPYTISLSGPGGYTRLRIDMTASQTNAVFVESASGFPSSGTIVIGAEQMTYTARQSVSFTGLGRGANNTAAVQHFIGEDVSLLGSQDGKYAQSDIHNATLSIRGIGTQGSNGLNWSSAAFFVDSITFKTFTTTVAALEGETVPLDNFSLVPTSRVTMEIDLTEFVLGESWDVFTAENIIKITYPTQTGTNGTRLAIYNVEIQLEVQGGGDSVTLVTEDNVQLTADVIGFFESTSDYTKISSEATITKLLEDSGYYGLTSADHSGLAAAILAARGSLNWRLDRRIARQTTLRDLLSSAVSDAGIRYGIDSGVFVFFPELGALSGDSVQSLVRADLTTGVTKERTHIDLVRNQIAVFFRRATTGELGFTRQREANDSSSQLLPWGTRRETVGAEWIRDSSVAVALANRLLDDFSLDRILIQGTFSLARTLTLEIGDVVTITDSLLNLSSVVGRVVGAIFPSPGQQRLTLAIPTSRTRIFNHSASGSFIDTFADQQRIMVVVDGTKVAMIRRTEFAITGKLIEETYNPEVAQSATYEYLAGSPNSIVVSTEPDGFFRALQFFAGGDLQVHEMEEDASTYPGTPALDAADVDFTADGTLTLAALISIAVTSGEVHTITDATNATPIVITSSTRIDIYEGQRVLIAGVLGNTAANGLWVVAERVHPFTLELVGSAGNGAYTSGGTATLSNYNGRLETSTFTEQATL